VNVLYIFSGLLRSSLKVDIGMDKLKMKDLRTEIIEWK
jgi:hypothetical protein